MDAYVDLLERHGVLEMFRLNGVDVRQSFDRTHDAVEEITSLGEITIEMR